MQTYIYIYIYITSTIPNIHAAYYIKRARAHAQMYNTLAKKGEENICTTIIQIPWYIYLCRRRYGFNYL